MDHNEIKGFIIELLTLFDIINYHGKTVVNALQLSSNYKIHFFDALIVATMEENSIYEIITENEKDFNKISNIRITNPFK